MYRRGGQVLGVTIPAAAATTITIPAAGMDAAVQNAVAAAAGLAVWAGVYVAGAFFGKR